MEYAQMTAFLIFMYFYSQMTHFITTKKLKYIFSLVMIINKSQDHREFMLIIVCSIDKW